MEQIQTNHILYLYVWHVTALLRHIFSSISDKGYRNMLKDKNKIKNLFLLLLQTTFFCVCILTIVLGTLGIIINILDLKIHGIVLHSYIILSMICRIRGAYNNYKNALQNYRENKPNDNSLASNIIVFIFFLLFFGTFISLTFYYCVRYLFFESH